MEGVKVSSYDDAKHCELCMQRRIMYKSVASTRHKQIRYSYICAIVSMVISLLSLWVCIRLHTNVAMNEDIAHLHAIIKDLTREINILKDGQKKVNDLQINQKSIIDDTVLLNVKNYTKYNFHENMKAVKEIIQEQKLHKNLTEPSSLKSNVPRHKIVKRSKKNRDRGKKKSSLPFIQIEGAGTQVHQTDKNAVTGFWTLPSWFSKKNKRVKAAKKFFEFSNLNNSGKLRVKKSGVYIVFAQFTLVGNPITGFHVSLEKSSANTKKILQCTQFVRSSTSGGSTPTQSCFTMGIVELLRDQEIFIQERQTNSGANYSNVSYFGLVRIAD